MVRGRPFKDVLEEEGVFDQSTARDIKEVPQVQFSAEWRFNAPLQEVVDLVVVRRSKGKI